MIPLEPEDGCVDFETLDRLVDDELAESDRISLLERLEFEPGGWRRCALAFLEAQSWRKELSGIADERESGTETTCALVTAATRRRTSRRLVSRAGTVLAMAASFVAALWLGWAVLDIQHSLRAPSFGPAEFAASPPGASPEMPPSGPAMVGSATEPIQRSIAPSGPWQMVTLSANGSNGQAPQSFDLPACERQRLDAEWSESLPPALPRDVLESLQRAGYRVRQHRELMPVEMKDGRRLVVPVEEVEFEYAGQPSL